ncbi:hypothetical protein [Paraclostridium bifermentans]|uniref:hypothetical protein n=1 Tax=Paraclostridium bifermentans TaxID=1490 RepID=UPI0025B01D86|nr:hypothetical protein [Paraclostridium bifermentans]
MFENLLNDNVILKKINGQIYKPVHANVQSNLILIPNTSLPIEEGDKIIRILPNKLTETYIVKDRGFHNGVDTIPSHYQVKVEKENIHKEKAVSSSVNNFYGDITNSQIQQNVRNSNQTMNTNESYDKKNELKAWLDDTLKQNLSSIHLESAKLDTVENALKNIESELEKSNSKPSIIKEGLSSIRTVLEGAAANLVASGLLYQLSQF